MSSVWSSFTQVKIVIFVHVTIFIQTQETCLMSCLRCNIFTLKQIEPLSITRCRAGFVCVCVFTLLPPSHYFVYLPCHRLLFQALHQHNYWYRPAKVTHLLWRLRTWECACLSISSTLGPRSRNSGLSTGSLYTEDEGHLGIRQQNWCSKLSTSRLFLGGWAWYLGETASREGGSCFLEQLALEVSYSELF